ncbi:MAG: hypothetical protein AAB792_02725 [Patescibacteria group bacterium]
MSRYSKYPSIGILEAIERLAFGGSQYNSAKKNLVRKEDLHTYFSKHDSSFDPLKFSKRAYEMKRGGLIEYSPDQDYIITAKGRQKINFGRIESLRIEKCKKDGFWRIIIFDVPEQRRGARDVLRDKLNEFGCYQLQKSIYATPYICEKEIEELCSLLDIGKYVDVIVARSLGQKEARIRNYFSR